MGSALGSGFGGPYDLRRAFLVGVLLPLAGLSASVVLLMVNWAERSLESRLQGEIELISRAVTPGISTNLEAGDDQEIRRNLESLFSIRRVYGAAVYDEDGDLVVSAGIADREVRTSDAASSVVQSGEDSGRYRSVEGENVYSYFSPLIDYSGRINGLLQITRDRQEIDATVAQVRTLGWSFWLLGVVASAVATLVLYRRLVGRHVGTLLSRMKAIGQGDRHVRFEAASPREFAEIGREFNSMVGSIARAEGELLYRQERERNLERRLQESERVAVVGQVVQGLAHELGSPLSVIDGRVRRLELEFGAGRGQRLLQDVRRQTSRMSDIVRQLLSYGSTEVARRSNVALGPLIASVVESAEHDRPQVTIRREPSDALVAGDQVRLELAISNLIRNALRHARSRVVVSVARREDGALELFVQDDGPGVPEADRAQVFEPFFTRQRSGQGTGLGLAIVASVMREHAGAAWCEAGPDGGARFVLRFPAELVS